MSEKTRGVITDIAESDVNVISAMLIDGHVWDIDGDDNVYVTDLSDADADKLTEKYGKRFTRC